jgi:murein DD-endopeptidase MepM/ murein hydrolase activator NlpD
VVKLLVLVVVLAGAVLLVTLAEPLAPSTSIETPVDVVGRATQVRVLARDRGTGLAAVEVRLVSDSGPGAVVAQEQYPSTTWRGSGIHSALVTKTIDASAAGLPEGPARLEVTVTDHSLLAGLRVGGSATRPVTIDLTPPTLEVINEERVARVGGSETAVYRVGSDTVEDGVQVGERFFPGTSGFFTEPGLRAALFALPQDVPDARPVAVAIDGAGNRRTAAIGITMRPRNFAEKTLPITDDFLNRKVPELLKDNDLPSGGDLVAGYLKINRELRASTEVRVREICRESANQPLWQGALLRLPNSAPLSGFADRRTYVHDGKEIDKQTHLGFDLASLRGSPVPAASAGRVAFAGPLGIYGTTVILDHGLGLFSLYGHLSELAVATGATVARGDTIGKTGETGLAGGDHLHFSVMIHGIHVDPVEWWDAHWIQDHVALRLGAFPRAGGATEAAAR